MRLSSFKLPSNNPSEIKGVVAGCSWEVDLAS